MIRTLLSAPGGIISGLLFLIIVTLMTLVPGGLYLLLVASVAEPIIRRYDLDSIELFGLDFILFVTSILIQFGIYYYIFGV